MKWIPKLISLVCLWGAVAWIVIEVEPELLKDIILPGSYAPFFILVTVATWYSFAIFIRSFWKSLMLSITLVACLVLSAMGVMHPGLLITLLLTLGIESWYIYNDHEKINSTDEQKNRGSSI